MQSFGDKIGDAATEPGEVDERTSGSEETAPAAGESLYGPGVPTAELYAQDAPDPEWDGTERPEPIFGLVRQPSSGRTGTE